MLVLNLRRVKKYSTHPSSFWFSPNTWWNRRMQPCHRGCCIYVLKHSKYDYSAYIQLSSVPPSAQKHSIFRTNLDRKVWKRLSIWQYRPKGHGTLPDQVSPIDQCRASPPWNDIHLSKTLDFRQLKIALNIVRFSYESSTFSMIALTLWCNWCFGGIGIRLVETELLTQRIIFAKCCANRSQNPAASRIRFTSAANISICIHRIDVIHSDQLRCKLCPITVNNHIL